MSKQVLHTEHAPQAVGTYSQAIRAGNTVYLSGQLGIEPVSGELQSGFAAQAHQMFRNLRAVCLVAGGDLGNIVRLGVFLTDMADFAELNRIMGEYFAAPYPARSAVQVAGLPRGGMVEADAVLVLVGAAT
jgi:reactive intermediate/imine deaminase